MTVAERREFRGAAAATTLNGAISASASTIVLADATNWPDGSVGPFFIAIDPGLSSEEKVKCISRTGNSITVVTSPALGRGADSTVATTHVSGAAVEHVWTADDANLANLHAADATVDNHTQYLNTTRHDVTARHPVGTAITAGTPGASAVGDAATAGVSTGVARSDHKHARESFGNPVASGVGDSMSAGSGGGVARSNHVHARENFGAASNVGSTISNGTSTAVSHTDHVHAAPFHTRVLNRTNTSIAGGVPPAATSGSANWVTQMGYSPVSTDGSGNFTVTFPTAFPGGLVSVVPMNPPLEFLNLTSANTSGFTCKTSVTDAGGHVVNAGAVSFSVAWIAVGW